MATSEPTALSREQPMGTMATGAEGDFEEGAGAEDAAATREGRE